MTIYTVKSGDSIYSIAREYGVPSSRIITDNFLTNPGRLVVGQDLVILFPTQTHTVRGGDTLDSIAGEEHKQIISDSSQALLPYISVPAREGRIPQSFLIKNTEM